MKTFATIEKMALAAGIGANTSTASKADSPTATAGSRAALIKNKQLGCFGGKTECNYFSICEVWFFVSTLPMASTITPFSSMT